MTDTDQPAVPPRGDAAADFDVDSHADPDELSPQFEADAVKQRPWRVAKSLLRLRDQVDAFAPKRSKKAPSQHLCHEPPFRPGPGKHPKTLGAEAVGTARNGCSGQSGQN